MRTAPHAYHSCTVHTCHLFHIGGQIAFSIQMCLMLLPCLAICISQVVHSVGPPPWATSVGPPLLDHLCWTTSVGPPLLDHLCWTTPVGPPLLDHLCWTTSVGPPLLDHLCWTTLLDHPVGPPLLQESNATLA